MDGSTGSRASSGTSGWSWSTAPSGPTRYQSGNGTPKKRWRLMHQSAESPSTQFWKRLRIHSGCQDSSLPLASRASLRLTVRTNHWRLVRISTGWLPCS